MCGFARADSVTNVGLRIVGLRIVNQIVGLRIVGLWIDGSRRECDVGARGSTRVDGCVCYIWQDTSRAPLHVELPHGS